MSEELASLDSKPRDAVPGKRKRDAKATRDEILAAATDEFAEKGLAGGRVEEIAARTATSKHMIYYHFGSKEGLYTAVLERAYAEFRLAEGAADYEALEPREALAALVGATFDIHANHPQIVRIIMAENINHGENIVAMDSFEQRKLALDTMRRILERGAKAGSLKSGLDPLQIHLSVSALCFHYIANVHTFGHVFGLDAHGAAELAARRREVIETIDCRCRAD